MKRYVFAGAAVAELDKQGRVIVPPDLLRTRPRQGRRRRRRARPHRDLGPLPLGGPWSTIEGSVGDVAERAADRRS